MSPPCRSPHGERGLKFGWRHRASCKPCRSPHGERGLKSWYREVRNSTDRGRSPHGERGLKFCVVGIRISRHLSLPTRGAWIEIVTSPQEDAESMSLPTRGAWIEIQACPASVQLPPGRSPHGERGLKSRRFRRRSVSRRSLPTRGAWIEILHCKKEPPRCPVAPHTGSVD